MSIKEDRLYASRIPQTPASLTVAYITTALLLPFIFLVGAPYAITTLAMESFREHKQDSALKNLRKNFPHHYLYNSRES